MGGLLCSGILKTKERKYTYKYNWVNAYKFVRYSFIDLFQTVDVEKVINDIISRIEKSIMAIIPKRKFVRQTQSI